MNDPTDYTHRTRCVMGGAHGWTWYCRSPGCVAHGHDPDWEVSLNGAIDHAFSTPRRQLTVYVNGYYVLPGSPEEAWARDQPYP